MIHELKTLPEYFEAVISGEKQFEVRKFDRPFHKGDLLALNEFANKMYTGRGCLVYIDYMLTDSEYVKKDYVILGIKPCAVHRFGSPYNFITMREDYKVPLVTNNTESEGTDAVR